MKRGLWRSYAADWEIMGAETVDKRAGNYSLTKHTSHHQHKTTQSENIPSSLPNLICHPPQAAAGFHAPEAPADLGRSL